MRILYVHNINQVAQINGSELIRRGHSISIHNPNLIGAGAPWPIKLAMMPERVFDLRQVVGKLNSNYFDLTHIHWATYGALGFTSRIPFIVECHGSDVRYHLKHPFFRPILTTIFRQAAAVLCITPDLLPTVQTVRPDAIFFPGPVDTDQFKPIENKQSHPWTILLFTRLDPIKGPEVAVQGIEQFIQRHTDVRVQLLDWGPLKGHYRQLYGGRFEFIPCIAPEEVQHLIWSADVVLGQFNLGILSFAELQAMSCAKPVICSFLYNNSYSTPPPIFQATTPEEIDAHLEYLFRKPEVRAELGQKAREWVINNHGHQTNTSKLERLYQSLI